MAFDFPSNPTLNQTYTDGVVSYKWNGYAWLTGSGGSATPGDYVLKAGDTMSGPLTLPGDPTAPLHATPKQYVDRVAVPPATVGNDGEALVALAGAAIWGAPISSGSF